MFEDDDEYYQSKVKAVVFIEKDNSVTVKFTGFEDKDHSAMFSSYLMMLLNIENAIINDAHSKSIH
ncbi:MAG: hypothetical protein RJA25_962 [Bacteroidota bacterium]|jgi:hypothetical protein